jgi:hypothetical protein
MYNSLLTERSPATNSRFADWRWAIFSAQMLMRRTELSATTKLSAEQGAPPFGCVLL